MLMPGRRIVIRAERLARDQPEGLDRHVRREVDHVERILVVRRKIAVRDLIGELFPDLLVGNRRLLVVRRDHELAEKSAALYGLIGTPVARDAIEALGTIFTQLVL